MQVRFAKWQIEIFQQELNRCFAKPAEPMTWELFCRKWTINGIHV